MQRFLLPLLLCSVFGTLAVSCKTNLPERHNEKSVALPTVQNLYFSDPATEYFYRTEIRIYGSEITGMLIAKQVAPDVYRLVMTGDFGNKMLDFEISETTFKINYIVPDLDRKVVKKFLEKDLRTLIRKNYNVHTKTGDSSSYIYFYDHANNQYRLKYSKETGLLSQITVSEKGREKSSFNYAAKSSIFADRIEILHQDIKLSIHLTSLNQ